MDYKFDIVGNDYDLDEENQNNIIPNLYFIHLRLSDEYILVDFGVRKRYAKRIPIYIEAYFYRRDWNLFIH